MSIIPNRKIWFIFSGTLIVLSVSALLLWGLRLGIDFTGGSLLELKFSGAPPARVELENVFTEAGLSAPGIQQTEEGSMVFRFAPITEAQHQEIVAKMNERFAAGALTAGSGAAISPVVIEEVRFDSIGPAIGKELWQKSVVAVILVTLAVLVYIAWSFRKISRPVPAWVYGVIVILTFIHDTIIPLGVFAWLGKFKSVEVGGPFIAAVLTILGYSINDTIVVLDRVRENLKRMKGSFEEVVEASVHQTIVRSLNTTFTTMLALAAILVFGGPTLQTFALALLIGIFFGAYSSIFIASPLLVVWYHFKRGR